MLIVQIWNMADKMSIITKITPEVREKVAAGIETLFKIGVKFQKSGQLVDSFVTNNGLSEPTSIVNINNMGSPGTLVYGGSEESNGSPYHFIVLASKLHFSSGEGSRRSCNYVKDSRYPLADDNPAGGAVGDKTLSPRRGQSCTYVLEGIVAGEAISLTYSLRAEVDTQGEVKLTETRRDNSHYWFGIDPKS